MTSYLSRNVFSGVSAGAQSFAFSWPYLDAPHVKLYTRTAAGSDPLPRTGFSFTSANVLNYTVPPGVSIVEVRRETPRDALLVQIGSGTTLTSAELNEQATQLLYIQQEVTDEEEDLTARAVLVPSGEASPVLPAAALRATKLFGFDLSGAPLLKTMADWLSGVVITVTSAIGYSVPTRGLLAGILLPSNGQIAYLSEPGHEGTFKFSTANLATAVTADTRKGLYVAPSSDTTGASGAWVREIQTPRNVKWFDATGDGATADQDAINATIASLTTGVGIRFPAGTYKLTGGVVFNGLSGTTLYSEGASLVPADGVTAVTITNCTSFHPEGPLTISGTSTASTAIGLACSGNLFWGLKDWTFFSLGVAANLGVNASRTYNGANINDPCAMDNLKVIECVGAAALTVTGEYYRFNGCILKGNKGTAALVKGGNVPWIGCEIIGNRIGVDVQGGITGNSDHSRIENCTINHNTACGVRLRDLQYGYHITGCEIYATIGDGTGTGQLSEEGQTTSFGIYLHNTQNVQITGNVIARNLVNVGANGHFNTLMTGNHLMTDPARTTDQVLETGFDNIIAQNAQNTLNPNMWSGTCAGGSTKRLNLLTTNKSLVYSTRGGMGTTGNNLALFTSTTLTPQVIVGDEDFITVVSDCPSTITIAPPYSYGRAFQIAYVPLTPGATKVVTLTGASPSLVNLLCSGVSVSGADLTFYEAGLYTFWPQATSPAWLVTRARGGPEAITAPALLNSWANTGSGNSTAGYYKDSDGRVNLRGTLAPATSGTVAFTLPVLYRPTLQHTLGAQGSAGKTAIATIATNGNVTITYDAGSTFVSLDGLLFNVN